MQVGKAIYFLYPRHTKTPPTAITAMPINGDQLKLCGLLAVIFKSPIFTTSSLVKKETVVKIVSANPIIMIIVPIFFINK
jgi:hypothetical protein